MGLSDELRELATLHEGGKLTDEEFVAAKQATISSRTPSGADEEQAADLLARLESLELIAAVRAQDGVRVKEWLSKRVNGSDGHGWTALFYAAGAGSTELVDQLLVSGADVNCVGKFDGRSPLMNAAANGHADVCAQLLKARADPALQDKNLGQTALDLAQQKKHGAVVAELERGRAELTV